MFVQTFCTSSRAAASWPITQLMRRNKCPKITLLRHTAAVAAFMMLPMTGPAQEAAQAVTARDIDNFAPHGMEMDFIALDAILFDFDKAVLTERAKRNLDAAARYILGQSRVYRILIEGHADTRASEDYNYQLAERRAAAVRDYLAAQGVAPRLLLTAGLGENFPVDEYWTREGRRRNRHVAIYIIERRPRGH